ncbi:hypothetical protein LguiA_020959 [Lonicera macranthoides]
MYVCVYIYVYEKILKIGKTGTLRGLRLALEQKEDMAAHVDQTASAIHALVDPKKSSIK